MYNSPLSMFSEQVVLDLIAQAYGAAEQPALWAVFLARLTAALDTCTATLDFYDLEKGRGTTVAAVIGMDSDTIAAYTDHYGKCNVLGQRMQAEGFFAPGTVVDNRALLDDAEFARTEYATDFFAKRFGVFHALAGVIFQDHNVSSNLSVVRRRSKPFEDHERKLFRVLMPHLQRSLSLHRSLSDAERRASLCADAIDLFATAAIIFDSRGQVVLMNAAAGRIILQADGLCTDKRSLRTSNVDETLQLHTMLASEVGGCMTVGRPSGKRPFIVSVYPRRVGDDRSLVMLISDPEDHELSDSSTLMKIHGFTRAEARVALLLLAGKTIKEAAGELDISIATARQHLKSLFSKTQTARQSEFVLLLSKTSRSQ
jgi:DNA-binding CsgD family transcriptional regulator